MSHYETYHLNKLSQNQRVNHSIFCQKSLHLQHDNSNIFAHLAVILPNSGITFAPFVR